MWRFEEEIVQLEKRYIDYRDPASPKPVVFYGGSSIRFWGPCTYSEFRGPYLSEALSLPHALNFGFGGALIQDCVYLFERLIVPHRPKAILIYAGDNDLANAYPSAQVLNAFRYLLFKTRSYLGKIPFTYISIKPSPLHQSSLVRIRKTNAMIAQELKPDEMGFFANIFDPSIDEQGCPRANFFLDDGIHLSAEGYRCWAETLLSMVPHHSIFGLPE